MIVQYVNKIPTYSFVWGFHDNGELITWHRKYFVGKSASQFRVYKRSSSDNLRLPDHGKKGFHFYG